MIKSRKAGDYIDLISLILAHVTTVAVLLSIHKIAM